VLLTDVSLAVSIACSRISALSSVLTFRL